MKTFCCEEKLEFFFFPLSFLQEKQVADALSAAESWQSRHAKEVKDKSKLEFEISRLNR